MNILFAGLLLLSTNILQGYGQVISDSRNFTGTLNQDLTLEWTFSGSTAFTIDNSRLYKDSVAVDNLISSGSSTELTPIGKEAFGERYVIEQKDLSVGVLTTKLKNVQFNDTGRIFILSILYRSGGLEERLSTYRITKVEGPGGGGTTGGSSGDSNAGLIAGVIIGVIVFIIIVVVCFVLFKRHKKNKRSGQVDGSDTNLRYGTNEDQYAETRVAMEQYDNEKKRHVAKEYAELGPGGGHDGPKAKSNPTHYHEVKRTDDGENARPSRDSPPPPPPSPPEPLRGDSLSDSDGNLVSDTVEV